MPETITVIIPTYNEAENIPLISRTILELQLDGLQILFVDDDSPDGSGQIAQQVAECYPGKVHVLHRKSNRGLGAAYLDGFAWAFKHGSDILIQMDADFSHSPNYLPQLVKEIRDCDLVIGSRYTTGGSLDERWGWHRRFLSWWANSVWVRLLLGVKTQDATSGFRCWKAEALRQLDLKDIRSNGYVFLVEMCYLAEQAGLHIREVPIHFRERDLGTSKMSLREQIQAALRVVEIRQRHRS